MGYHRQVETTLRQRVLGGAVPETTSSGPSPELNNEEIIFVEHLKSMDVLGYVAVTEHCIQLYSHLRKRNGTHLFSTK